MPLSPSNHRLGRQPRRPRPLALPRRLPLPGRLTISSDASVAAAAVWVSDNGLPASDALLLDSGNLVLLSQSGSAVWESFDSPADTWLPGMAMTRQRRIVSWRSPSDPSPGPFSLRLRPPAYGEFELVFDGSVPYWSTGNWTGTQFAGVPEMTVPYIYEFRFAEPFGPEASFSYAVAAEAAAEAGLGPPALSRFVVDPSGRLMQYAWSPQSASWSMFWSRPEGECGVYGVYGRCGSLGVCAAGDRSCECPPGLRPADPAAWSSGDFSGGCSRAGDPPCSARTATMMTGSRRWAPRISTATPRCRSPGNLYGNAYNLRNRTDAPILFLRVSASSLRGESSSNAKKKKQKKTTTMILIGVLCGSLAIFGSLASILTVIILRRRRRRRRGGGLAKAKEDDGTFSNVTVFSYKELYAATRGFSEKLGHGGFGAVFRGELPGATPVAVKRLERGGGEREFRAEVRTIGSVHHVNLVRLRGFCCEGPHRLLVYDLAPLGSLSAHLGAAAAAAPLSWAARLRIAVGTARGVAYLHEACRDCIIHCDIKPENILLDSDYTPKVSDFGLATLVGRGDPTRAAATSVRGTWGYVAPEWVSGGAAITPKADVYSFGMTLLEILSGRRNAESATFAAWAAGRIAAGDDAAAAAVADPRLAEVGGYDAAEAERVARVAVWCVQDEESARPGMGAVVQMLEGAVAPPPPPPPPRLLRALVASGDSFPRPETSNAASGNDSEVSVGSDSDGPSRVGEDESESRAGES
uniref:Receptor-like serine/threonine-protein kinase n=1 Tax=Ananas comosus var. bracteatus TaxID=296719 RepID=A0A6V7PJF6_ANACO|nr:unnamed protein product [Ananas comosus var. bracteatus]